MKRIFLFLCALTIGTSLYAQEHLFEVKRFKNWGKEYLTVTNNYFYTKWDTNNEKIVNVDSPLTIEGYDFLVGDLILEINGQSTKDMSERDFYAILDNSTEKISLKVKSYKTKNIETSTVSAKATIPDFANRVYIQKALQLALNGQSDKNFDTSYLHYYSDMALKRKGKFFHAKVKCFELTDPDFDWFNVSTYDFAIVSDQPLVDRSIFEQLRIPESWKRDTKNPDVIFTIAKDSKQSINSTYIPPTVRTINHGSKTTSRYNALTKQTEYTTTQNNQTVREGGYTKTISNNDIYLELAMLDAKRINDPNQQTAPIVWQATFEQHITDPSVNAVDQFISFASYVRLYDFIWANNLEAHVFTFERVWAYSKDGVVTYAEPNSPLKVGDKIIKYQHRKKADWTHNVVRNLVEEDDNIYSQCWGHDHDYQYYRNNLYIERFYKVQVQHADGKKETLQSVPFLKKTGSVRLLWTLKEYQPNNK